MHNVAFIKTGDGNLTLVLDAKTFSIGTSHPNYSRILDSLKNREYDDLENLIDVPLAITKATNGAVTVHDGQVFYNNLPMHNTVTERILAFMSEGLPTMPLVLFLENLMANPMPMAVAELFDFLEHRGFPITEDGCFIGYKGVRDDFLDCHSGTNDNSVGRVVSIPREQVDPNRRNECSYGLHVGTLQYAAGFGSTVVLVKVNPKDAIAVPKDHDCSKLRVCEYKVIAVSDKTLIESPMYPMPEQTPAYSEDENDTDCNDLDDDWDDDDFNDNSGVDEDEGDDTVITTVTTVTKTPKRPPCSDCGAKGGKRHARACNRPRK